MTDPVQPPDRVPQARPDDLSDEVTAAVRAHRDTFRRLGWILVALGVAAIVFPLVASIAVKVLVGWLLLLSGAAMLYHAFQSRSWRSALPSGAIGVLNLAVGVYLAFFPLTGLIGLTFLLGLMFLLQGGFEGSIAAAHRPRKGWGWLALSGVASFVLGALLIFGLPETALWALGVMVGINLLSSGMSFVALARSA